MPAIRAWGLDVESGVMVPVSLPGWLAVSPWYPSSNCGTRSMMEVESEEGFVVVVVV